MDKQTVNVFIASSNTLLSEDRDHFTRIFEDININILPHLNFEPRRWKENLDSGSFDGINIQDKIDAKLFDSCEIVFVIVYSKIGEYTKYEFNRALRDGKKVFLYFKKGFSPSDSKSAEEYAEVFRFKEKAQNQGVILSEYGTKEDLQKEAQKDIILFARDHYPIEDKSIVKLFNAIKETIEKEYLNEIKYFLILPDGFYNPKDLFMWFGLTAAEKDTAKKALILLSEKGVLIEKEGSYALHSAIKNLFQRDTWKEYADYVYKILETFKENIEALPTNQGISYHQLNIKIIENFIKSEVFQVAKGTFELRRTLVDYYINRGLPRDVARSEKLLTSFEEDGIDNNNDIAYISSLAKVYYKMYLAMRDRENELYNGEGSHYLRKAKTLFDNFKEEIHPMSYANLLRMQIRESMERDFQSLRNDCEKLWSNFDGKFPTDTHEENIRILVGHLELATTLNIDNNLISKIHENIVVTQKELTGPTSIGYLSRCIQFCEHLGSYDNREQYGLILDQIASPIKQVLKDPKNVEIREGYTNLIVTYGAT